jgi:hypothetical protein
MPHHPLTLRKPKWKGMQYVFYIVKPGEPWHDLPPEWALLYVPDDRVRDEPLGWYIKAGNKAYVDLLQKKNLSFDGKSVLLHLKNKKHEATTLEIPKKLVFPEPKLGPHHILVSAEGIEFGQRALANPPAEITATSKQFCRI